MLPTRRFGVLAAVAVLFVAGAVGPAAAAGDGSVVADPTDPDAVEYDVAPSVNPQSSGGEATTTLAVGSGMNETTTDSMTDGEMTDSMTDREMDEANGDGTGATAPGFGPTVAVVGLLTVALLALRGHRR